MNRKRLLDDPGVYIEADLTKVQKHEKIQAQGC